MCIVRLCEISSHCAGISNKEAPKEEPLEAHEVIGSLLEAVHLVVASTHADRSVAEAACLQLDTKDCRESVRSSAAASGILPCLIWLLSSGTATSVLRTARHSRSESPSSPHTTCIHV